jgi:hypothetical protein
VIILEGPDGSGKTTLAKNLEKFGYTYLHQGPPGQENLFERYKRVLTTYQRTGGKVVCDRLFHGELVYGPVMRGHSRLTEYQLCYLELLARDSVMVWCSAPPEKLVQRGDPIYNSVDPEELLDRYSALASRSSINLQIHYDSYQMDAETTAPMLARMDKLKEPWPFRGVGNRYPLTVLVGEGWPGRLPPPGDDRWDMEPYVSMRPFDASQSGRFLLDAIGGEPGIYLTNARKQWTTKSVAELRLELQSLGTENWKLLALGHEAFRELCVAGYRSRAVLLDHPQYFRRFHFEKSAEYGEKLRKEMYGDH